MSESGSKCNARSDCNFRVRVERAQPRKFTQVGNYGGGASFAVGVQEKNLRTKVLHCDFQKVFVKGARHLSTLRNLRENHIFHVANPLGLRFP